MKLMIKYFSSNNKLRTIKCHNNSLVNSKTDMSDILSSLETFTSVNNDFGEFIWNPSLYDAYNLKHIDLTNANIYGSNNDDLNISINFIYLDGQTFIIFKFLKH